MDGKTDRPIDCTKADNLRSLSQVLDAQERNKRAFQEAMKLPPTERKGYIPLYGVGFSLAKGLPGLDGLKGIDLDHCLSRGIDQWAKDIVDDLRTYTEFSPSGTGLRLFVRGDLPDGYKHKVTGLGPEGRGVLEVYEESRYLTITGDAILSDANANEELDEDWFDAQIDLYGLWINERDLSCLTRYLAPDWTRSASTHRGREKSFSDNPLIPDEDIIAQLSSLPLWEGDTSGHNGDHSAADLALCNLIAKHTDDPEQVDRVFRQSGLMRDKWDEKRGSRTYGEMTVEKALEANCNGQELGDTENEPGASKQKRANPWKAGDWGDELMARTFPEPRWAIEGLLPEGVTLLAGTKSIGKSWFALNAGISVSQGTPAFDKIPVRQGKVLYLSLEDSDRLLQTRLHVLLDGDRSRLGEKSFAPRYTSDLLGHGFESGLEGWMSEFPDTRLVVVDLLANIFLPQEKKSEYFTMYHAVSRLCKTADNLHVSMLVLHHTNTRNEAELNDPFDAIMGGQGIKACVAGCMLLYRQRFNTSMSLMLAGKHVKEAVFNLERDES